MSPTPRTHGYIATDRAISFADQANEAHVGRLVSQGKNLGSFLGWRSFGTFLSTRREKYTPDRNDKLQFENLLTKKHKTP